MCSEKKVRSRGPSTGHTISTPFFVGAAGAFLSYYVQTTQRQILEQIPRRPMPEAPKSQALMHSLLAQQPSPSPSPHSSGFTTFYPYQIGPSMSRSVGKPFPNDATQRPVSAHEIVQPRACRALYLKSNSAR